jgi:octopine/nopaline transport system permease protein
MELIQLAVPVLLKGLWMTLTLTALSVAIGFCPGLGPCDPARVRQFVAVRVCALLQYCLSRHPTFGADIPDILRPWADQFIHDTPAMWWVVSEGSRCAVLALALNTAAYTSEICAADLLLYPLVWSKRPKPAACRA